MSTSREIEGVLVSERNISPLIPLPYLHTPPLWFDFSKQNPEITNVDMSDAAGLESYINKTLAESERTWGMGGYGEDRFFYEKSPLFKSGDEYRSIHIGLDLWLPANTEIFVPLDATVHSFQNNDAFLDYGPTIILQHELDGIIFFTLYGHLSGSSLDGLSVGKKIAHGQHLATLGETAENGSWPPHLHFQIIGDLLGKSGDYPGVVVPSESKRYLDICPDPELLLKPFLVK